MTQDAIRTRIEEFAVELEKLVRAAAVDAVRQALGGGAPQPAPRAIVRQPVRAAAARPAAPAAAAPATNLAFKRKKGAKRSPEQLAQLDAAAVAFVKDNPGKGVEHMAKGLGVPSNDLKSRIALLIDAKKLRKTGHKRATKYFSNL